jgi:hypothetical protein
LDHLRARLNAIGELMTRVARDGRAMRSERHTASESARRFSERRQPDDRPRDKPQEKHPAGMRLGMDLERRRGRQRKPE